MTDEEFAEIMALGHERAGVEFKGPGPLADRRLTAQVVKAMLGMANRRDGGIVVVGVADNDGSLDPVGVNSADLTTWSYDRVADRIASYADPGVNFEVEIKEHQDNRYIVIEVSEFDDIPVLCKRAYDDVLREGACYVRPRRKPETSEIPTQADMRDLLELASDKVVMKYIDRARRLGLIPSLDATPQTGNEDVPNPGSIGEL